MNLLDWIILAVCLPIAVAGIVMFIQVVASGLYALGEYVIRRIRTALAQQPPG